MDASDLDFTDVGSADLQGHTDLGRVADELRTALVTIGGLTPGLDEPITAVRSWGLAADGETLSVQVDLPHGATRVYSFTPGRPVGVVDND